jgi:hypothetical protein
MRATIQQKAGVSEALASAYAAEQITTEELEERTAKAFQRGVTEGTLRRQLDDLCLPVVIDSIMNAERCLAAEKQRLAQRQKKAVRDVTVAEALTSKTAKLAGSLALMVLGVLSCVLSVMLLRNSEFGAIYFVAGLISATAGAGSWECTQHPV